ncbi:hypothetical protein UlMin_009847 [Ulmus minor]
MALVPSRQFYPTSFFDSFQSSFSRFHGCQLQFFRYGSSITLRKLPFCANQCNITSSSTPEHNPQRKSNFLRKNHTSNQYKEGKSLSSSSWIDKWNEPHQQNRPKQPRAVLDYASSESGNRDSSSSSSSGGGSTMDKIVEKLKKFGYVDDGREKKEEKLERVIEKGSVEDIFYVEEGMLPNSRGGFSPDSPFGVENVFGGVGEVRFPWEKPKENEEQEGGSMRRRSRTSLAELTLPESELRRLRNLTFQKKHKTRIGGGGVTQAVVDMIHERWKTSEIVRLKIEGPPALNMKRMHEILERKTGGLVVWRSGTSLSLYRGVSYEVPSLKMNKRIYSRNEAPSTLRKVDDKSTRDFAKFASDRNVETSLEKPESTAEEKKGTVHQPETKYEDEVDKLLEGLGPRYTDWPGCDPLPVDADMLPGFVPGYEPPFRILPFGVRPSLGQREATALRRLARFLPPHFALGRSRQLQGLAVAMIKLWERSSIAKIALKRGVQLTTSERMAEELKKLTGGMLLSRNKDFLVFYRGKSFLSREVSETFLERERSAEFLQDEEEQARLRASAIIIPRNDVAEQSRTAGTLAETLDANAKWGTRLDDRHKEKVMREAEIVRHASLVRKLEDKLAFAERRLMKAERALSKVEEFLKPANRPADPDSITDEERFMFRKLGLRMKAFLLLGRRGVFDGTVENMHLHWKYRELVKIVVNARTFDQVRKVALALEAESGGVLVSVDKISRKKFAIVVFRGKDYQRPKTLRPKNLLTKRKALARSIELQRQEAILKHMSAMQSKVDKLRSELEEMDDVKHQGDEALYDRLDSAYPTDDDSDESEEEGDEAYLEPYGSEDETDDPIRSLHLQTEFPSDNQNQEPQTESEAPAPHFHGIPNDSSIGVDLMEEEDDHQVNNSPRQI